MSGIFGMDWAILAVSLFNTIILFWLGLTILLNAERRSFGIWLAGCGLLAGGLFFICHTIVVERGLKVFGDTLDFWLSLGGLPVILLPVVWYALALWFNGYWDDRKSPFHRLHRPWLLLASGLSITILALAVLVDPIPSFTPLAHFRLFQSPAISGISLVFLIYSVYIVLCMSLALGALVYPGPTNRVMGDKARSRARPWLVGVTLSLLLVGLLVTWVLTWLSRALEQYGIDHILYSIAGFDLTIALMISISTSLLGQALVSYEVFTGKTLPRGGLVTHWRRAIILAGGFGVVISWSLVVDLPSVFSSLLSAMLIAIFYALLVWRSYAERERFIAQLRPFITSQNLYDQLLTQPSYTYPNQTDLAFETLCRDILDTELAYLLPQGTLAPLFGPGLAFPIGQCAPPIDLVELKDHLSSPRTLYLPIPPQQYGGSSWAITLWGEPGLIGVLLVGEKRGNRLYTHEEFEIARTIGERIVDSRSSAEMARRLMGLQRQRIAENQVIDRRARRALHDEVLPRLHAAMLALTSEQQDSDQNMESVTNQLGDIHRLIADLLREMPAGTTSTVARLGLIGALRQAVNEEYARIFDQINWKTIPEAEQKAGEIPPLIQEVIYYAACEIIRNAARHGRSAGVETPLNLDIEISLCETFQIMIQDNGPGFDALTPPASLPNNGTGQGLALHSTLMAVVGGSLSIESMPGKTRVLLNLPI